MVQTPVSEDSETTSLPIPWDTVEIPVVQRRADK